MVSLPGAHYGLLVVTPLPPELYLIPTTSQILNASGLPVFKIDYQVIAWMMPLPPTNPTTTFTYSSNSRCSSNIQ